MKRMGNGQELEGRKHIREALSHGQGGAVDVRLLAVGSNRPPRGRVLEFAVDANVACNLPARLVARNDVQKSRLARATFACSGLL